MLQQEYVRFLTIDHRVVLRRWSLRHQARMLPCLLWVSMRRNTNPTWTLYCYPCQVQGRDWSNLWFDGRRLSSMTLMLWLRWSIQHSKGSTLLNPSHGLLTW